MDYFDRGVLIMWLKKKDNIIFLHRTRVESIRNCGLVDSSLKEILVVGVGLCIAKLLLLRGTTLAVAELLTYVTYRSSLLYPFCDGT